ncbi:MAG: hypothetical protein ACKOTA_03630, partial [Solirubrobacterales bacterium]
MERMGRVLPKVVIAACAATLALPALAGAQSPPPVEKPVLPEGTVTKSYRFPLTVKSGQNLNLYDYLNKAGGRPGENGWIVGFRPNLKRMDGSTPPVDEIHLHHAVWLADGRITFGAGEEKTAVLPPTGYGYRYTTSQRWLLNHMIHNLTATPEKVWIEMDRVCLAMEEHHRQAVEPEPASRPFDRRLDRMGSQRRAGLLLGRQA